MTFEEYNKEMDRFMNFLEGADMGDSFSQEMLNDMYAMQNEYMNEVLKEAKLRENESEAWSKVCEVLEGIITESTSGNIIVYVGTEELLEEVEGILWSEYGDYLLDTDATEDRDGLNISCYFGGYYTPYWDDFVDQWGWGDYW